MYADDTQIYITMSPGDRLAAVNSLRECLMDVKAWSTTNRLRLNEDKSELIHFSSQFKSTDPLTGLTTQEGVIKTSECVRDLGFTLDKHLTLKHHITNICKSASWGIFKIGKIRRLLDQSSAERLVHAFVSSHLFKQL